MSVFNSYQLEKSQLLYSDIDSFFPSALYTWKEKKIALQTENSTFFGFVYSGVAIIETALGNFPITPGMYFCIPKSIAVSGGTGIIIERIEFNGLLSIGGPIEATGRLKYINGCTDSLLISPPKKGDPCLNALFFPPDTNQSPHTHPSSRIGIVVHGSGDCFTSEGTYPLNPGTVFIIKENGIHSFRTLKEKLSVIAYHPDSDFGPEDDDHPMINRTFIE